MAISKSTASVHINGAAQVTIASNVAPERQINGSDGDDSVHGSDGSDVCNGGTGTTGSTEL
jgi:hypothetical protein